MTEHLPRTARVDILVTKTLEIDEPDWCTGHPNDRAQFKPDITHFGPEHLIEINGHRILLAMLAQSPYSQRSSREVSLYVEQGDFTGSYSPAEVAELAHALIQAGEQLRVLGQGLADVTDGGGQ